MARRLLIISRVFIAAAILIVAANGVFLVAQLANHDDGETGYFMLTPPVIADVSPDGPAALAGLRAGDRIDISRLDLHRRLTAFGYRTVLDGERIALPIVRDGTTSTYVVVTGPVRTALAAHTYRIIWSVIALAIIAFALIVFARRPGIEGFALTALSFAYVGYLSSQYRAPDWFTIGDTLFLDATIGMWVAGAAIIALRVTRLSERKRFLEWLALGVGLCLAGTNVYLDAVPIFLARPANPLLASINQGTALSMLLFLVVVVPIVAVAFVRASGMARVRLRWIALGFAFLACEAAVAYVQNLSPALYGTTWLAYLRPTFAVGGMGMLGIAIARRELFDVGFVVNRATIFAIVTGLLVGAFAALNWLIGSALKSTGLALPIGVVVAGAVALSLRTIQRRVTGIVDRVLFRQRYAAERRLARIARAVPLLGDADALVRALIDEPVEALRLSAGALYLRSGSGTFDLISSTGWPKDAPQVIEPADPLILYATGEPDVLALDDVVPLAKFPNGPLRPRTAIAVPGPHGPAALVLFSAHRSGAALDPDESAALERVAMASSIAFERLRAAAEQRRLDKVLNALTALYETHAPRPPSTSPARRLWWQRTVRRP